MAHVKNAKWQLSPLGRPYTPAQLLILNWYKRQIVYLKKNILDFFLDLKFYDIGHYNRIFLQFLQKSTGTT